MSARESEPLYIADIDTMIEGYEQAFKKCASNLMECSFFNVDLEAVDESLESMNFIMERVHKIKEALQEGKRVVLK